jgi:hypothetical protein
MALLPANSWVTRADRPDLLMLFHWRVCRPEHPNIRLTNKYQYAADGADGADGGTETTDTATPRQSADPNVPCSCCGGVARLYALATTMNGLTSIHRVDC